MGDDYRSLSRYWRRGAAELLHGRKGRGRAWIGGLFELVDGCHGPLVFARGHPRTGPPELSLKAIRARSSPR